MTNSIYINSNIKAVFFDVAQTLLYKPDLYQSIALVLKKHYLNIDIQKLIITHKLYSETITFPNKTSRDFYQNFNREFLYLLGIIPNQNILDEIYESCSYLPWNKFEDASVLNKIRQPIGIISNWDETLSQKLNKYFDIRFEWILGSQDEGIKKPNTLLYNRILEVTKLKPSEIIYVGDSIKLDIEPAIKIGINAILIDRIDLYSNTNISRIKNLNELLSYL